MTKREQIVRAIVARIEAVPGVSVERGRLGSMEAAGDVQVVVEPASEDALHLSTDITQRTLSVSVRCHFRDQQGNEAADPYLSAIHAAVLSGNTLGGLVDYIIDTTTEWDFNPSDLYASRVEMRFECRYSTGLASLS